MVRPSHAHLAELICAPGAEGPRSSALSASQGDSPEAVVVREVVSVPQEPSRIWADACADSFL